MRDIPLNDYALSILKNAEWFIQEENYKAVKLKGENQLGRADYWTGDEYFQKVKSMGRSHNGFPECACSYSYSNNQLDFSPGLDITLAEEASERQRDFLREIQTVFNFKRNALFNVYPPGGFISWHNNANASAYNFIFTYSETGDGYWKHWDNKNMEFVTIPDKKGWQCKVGYFGAYEDTPDKLVYHTARNGDTGLRFTIAFVLERSEMSVDLQKWVVEDISA